MEGRHTEESWPQTLGLSLPTVRQDPSMMLLKNSYFCCCCFCQKVSKNSVLMSLVFSLKFFNCKGNFYKKYLIFKYCFQCFIAPASFLFAIFIIFQGMVSLPTSTNTPENTADVGRQVFPATVRTQSTETLPTSCTSSPPSS